MSLVVHRLRRSLDPRAEDGIALVLTLAVLLLFTVTVVTASNVALSTQGTARSSSAQQTSYALAEAGVNAAESILNANNTNASSPTLLGCSVSQANVNNSATPCTDLTVNTSYGTASFHGIYTQGSGSNGTWTISSSGGVTSPVQGANAINRATSATISISGGGQSNNISVWNYIYSTAPQGAGCELDLNGNHMVVTVPMYVTGDLCISGNGAGFAEDTANGGQAIDLRVGGTLTNTANAGGGVGSSGHPITSGYVAGGCRTTSGGTFHACTSADVYYVSQTDTPLTASPPVMDFPTWYTNASPGPSHICDTTLTASPNLTAAGNKFDNDVTMNGTNTSFELTPASDYNCVTSSGTLSWNHTTHLLTINGTIMFDGNVTVSDSAAFYHGRATIYVNGTLVFSGSMHAGCPASPAAATGQCAFNTANSWNPAKDMIIFAVNKQNATAISLTGNQSEFQGDVMCQSNATMDLSGNHANIEGGIICGKYLWGNHVAIYPLPTVSNLPPGAPLPPNAPASITPPTYTN